MGLARPRSDARTPVLHQLRPRSNVEQLKPSKRELAAMEHRQLAKFWRLMGRYNLSEAVQLLWGLVYEEPWPEGWKVYYGESAAPLAERGTGAALAKTRPKFKLIQIDPELDEPEYRHRLVPTLLHEFVHVRRPDLHHKEPEFMRLENRSRKRVGWPRIAGFMANRVSMTFAEKAADDRVKAVLEKLPPHERERMEAHLEYGSLALLPLREQKKLKDQFEELPPWLKPDFAGELPWWLKPAKRAKRKP